MGENPRRDLRVKRVALPVTESRVGHLVDLNGREENRLCVYTNGNIVPYLLRRLLRDGFLPASVTSL